MIEKAKTYYHLANKNKGVTGGWKFFMPGGYMINSSGLDKLVAAVRQHIEVNGEEVPLNLAEIVEDQICRRIPANFVKEDIYDTYPFQTKIEETTRRVIDMLNQDGVVDVAAVLDRSDICQPCMLNRSRVGCKSCDDFSELAGRLNGSSVDPNLRICDMTACGANILVRCSQELIRRVFRSVPASDLPEKCWLSPILSESSTEEN